MTYLPTIYLSSSTLGAGGFKLQIYTATDLAIVHYYIKGTRIGDSNKNIYCTIRIINYTNHYMILKTNFW